eukprot:CFRG1479T1
MNDKQNDNSTDKDIQDTPSIPSVQLVTTPSGSTSDRHSLEVSDKDVLSTDLDRDDFRTAVDSDVPMELPKDEQGIPTERIVFVNNPMRNSNYSYKKNYVSTAKYTAWTFIPVNLFEQFQRVANVYFLLLIILQLIPQVSALNPITTAFPLLLVLCVTAIKDGFDDYARHQSDKEVNTREVEVLREGQWVNILWQEVETGDIVRVEQDDPIACDIMVLATATENGEAFVETAELDGETNLKLRLALKETAKEMRDDSSLGQLQGFVRCEPPNTDLHYFKGNFQFANNVNLSLDNENILLRGMTLRNTKWVTGLAIFTGHETKLMKNASGTQFKRTKIDIQTNRLILYIFVLLAIVCCISAIGSGVWSATTGEDFEVYLPFESGLEEPAVIGILAFFTFIILYSTLVPISLYVSVEFIRLGQSFLIDWDLNMYHADTDTPAKARTTTLNEELGQIDFVFSDKTGTLTQNVMRFFKCTIRGTKFGKGTTEAGRAAKQRERTSKKILQRQETVHQEVDFSGNKYADPEFVFYDDDLFEATRNDAPDARRFFTHLALCHTVQAEDVEGSLKYSAQSPDEAALVQAAKNFNYVFLKRNQNMVTLRCHGEDTEHEILNILEFNSDRKRMSVIVRGPDKKIRIYTKGADSVMLSWRVKNDDLSDITNNHLEEFSTEGLRTLVLADREISDVEYEEWSEKYRQAALSLENRAEELDAVAELIEKELELIGASAIEDKLQEGVPQTIASLRKANIRVWVLTGDKQETAINIGFSCQLLSPQMEIFIVNERGFDDVSAKLKALKDQIEANPYTQREMALVIDGNALGYALDDELKIDLLEIAEQCASVVCCRVSPIQKALVVKLVKENREAITLAIGDGANDVSMIQNAHIGVGISGLEGRQAVLASDFSIAQFRFLERLLLVHGRWSYMRMCRFLTYFFYKNFAFTLCQFWYAIFTGWSGQTIFDATFVTMYNVIFTALPIIAAGLFEQDVSDRVSQLYPHMYGVGQKDLLFNTRIFALSLLLGVYHSACCFFFVYGACAYNILSDGHTYGYQWFGVLVSGAVVVVVNLQQAIDLYRWTIINHVFVILSIISWWVFTWFQYSMTSLIYMVGYYGVNFNSQGEALWWFTLIITVAAAMLPVFVYNYCKIYFYPTPVDIVREITNLSRMAREGQGRLQETRSSRHSVPFFGSQNFNATLLAAVSGVDVHVEEDDDDDLSHVTDCPATRSYGDGEQTSNQETETREPIATTRMEMVDMPPSDMEDVNQHDVNENAHTQY